MQFVMAQRVNRDVREPGEHVLTQNLFMPNSSNFFFCFKIPGYNLGILSSVAEQLKEGISIAHGSGKVPKAERRNQDIPSNERSHRRLNAFKGGEAPMRLQHQLKSPSSGIPFPPKAAPDLSSVTH